MHATNSTNARLKFGHSDKQTPEREIIDNYTGVGTWCLRNIWYFAAPGWKLGVGRTIAKTIMGEQILIGRDRNGAVFAVQDICPHQAVPFSKGHFDGCKLECPFHGWKFDTNGRCSEIPSLTVDQKFDTTKIKVKTYPCTEQQGNIWVYIGDACDPVLAPPTAPGIEGLNCYQSTVTLLIPTHIDFAVAALIDPAHVPYVHNAWWWRSTKRVKEKTKQYLPDENGWTILRHRPSDHSFAFQLFGRFIETEISFRLPGCRREYLTFDDKTFLSGLTALTPIDNTHTELNHTTYWTLPNSGFMAPIINRFVRVFLGQDLTIAKMQEVCLRAQPKLIMTIPDAGTPGHWYFKLKKEWAVATEENRLFVNPISPTLLRWRT